MYAQGAPATQASTMTDKSKQQLAGAALIVLGVGTLLFGGSKSDGGTTWTLFGFEFGHERREPMSRGESLFWGIAMVLGGVALIALA